MSQSNLPSNAMTEYDRATPVFASHSCPWCTVSVPHQHFIDRKGYVRGFANPDDVVGRVPESERPENDAACLRVEIERLTALVEDIRSQAGDGYRAEIARLREALEFYAARESWTGDVADDRGSIAREALSGASPSAVETFPDVPEWREVLALRGALGACRSFDEALRAVRGWLKSNDESGSETVSEHLIDWKAPYEEALRQRDALTADAERYRFLRDQTFVEAYYIDGAGGVDTKTRCEGAGEHLDLAVDMERIKARPRSVKAGENRGD